MPKRRGKSAASKQQKTPKSQIEGTVLIRACCVEAGATRPKADDERFYHNKKKLERLLNAKIICKEDDKENQSRSKTGDERFHHNKEKLERALNAKIICKEDDKEDQSQSKTGDERFRHNKKKLERALNAKIICKENDKEEQDDGEAIMKKLDKWCKDNTNYTRGMKIVFSAYVL